MLEGGLWRIVGVRLSGLGSKVVELELVMSILILVLGLCLF
jgi:hypothetical protein